METIVYFDAIVFLVYQVQMSRSDITRYAMAAVAVKEMYPKMMRKLAEVHRSAPMLHTMIVKDKRGINEILHEDEKKLVDTLRSGYDMFDETLMYKMISFFNIVRQPSNNWGKSPTGRHQTTLGDDIERLRKRRNILVHSPEPQLSESQFEEFFDELSEIAQRFDTHLHQSTFGNRFQDEVINMKRRIPDPEAQAKYIETLEKVSEKTSK